MTSHIITTEAELEALYGTAQGAALFKEIDHISDDYAQFIEASPFVVVATVGANGLDCTPRGDPAGFVRIQDRKTVLLPDRRGNNRLDTLRNLVRDPRISLLFLIPGEGRTLRINGTAQISTDPELCNDFIMENKPPRSVLIVTAKKVYFQCPKALVRSRLWNPETPSPKLPSTGAIIKALQADFDAEGYERDYPQRLKETIY